MLSNVTPGWIRTPDLVYQSPMPYPVTVAIWMSCKLGPVNHIFSKSPDLFASVIVLGLKLPENKGDTKTHRVSLLLLYWSQK